MISQALKAAEARLSALKVAQRVIGRDVRTAESNTGALRESLEEDIQRNELDFHGARESGAAQKGSAREGGSDPLAREGGASQHSREGGSTGVVVRRFPPLPRFAMPASRRVSARDLGSLVDKLRRATSRQGEDLHRASQPAAWAGVLPGLGLEEQGADQPALRLDTRRDSEVSYGGRIEHEVSPATWHGSGRVFQLNRHLSTRLNAVLHGIGGVCRLDKLCL